MPSYEYQGKRPRVHPRAFVAPTAVLIGDVEVAEGASVWFGTVLRGDMARIVIGARTSVQDNSVLHTEADEPTIIGEDVTIGHLALVHSSVVERNVLIGQAAVLVGSNHVGSGAVIGSGAVLPEGMKVPERSLVLGVPGRVIRETRPDDERWTVRAAEHYVELGDRYRQDLERVD